MASEQQTKKYGWYSYKAAENHGTIWYSTEDGKEAEVTIISNTMENPYSIDSAYNKDAVCRGLVCNWLRKIDATINDKARKSNIMFKQEWSIHKAKIDAMTPLEDELSPLEKKEKLCRICMGEDEKEVTATKQCDQCEQWICDDCVAEKNMETGIVCGYCI